jgi:hypothetical protein
VRHPDPLTKLRPHEALAFLDRLQDLRDGQRQSAGRHPLERLAHCRHRRVGLDVEIDAIGG